MQKNESRENKVIGFLGNVNRGIATGETPCDDRV